MLIKEHQKKSNNMFVSNINLIINMQPGVLRKPIGLNTQGTIKWSDIKISTFAYLTLLSTTSQYLHFAFTVMRIRRSYRLYLASTIHNTGNTLNTFNHGNGHGRDSSQ